MNASPAGGIVAESFFQKHRCAAGCGTAALAADGQ